MRQNISRWIELDGRKFCIKMLRSLGNVSNCQIHSKQSVKHYSQKQKNMKFFIPLSALLAGALALPAASQGAAGGSCSALSQMKPELESLSASLPEILAIASEYLLLFFVCVCV